MRPEDRWRVLTNHMFIWLELEEDAMKQDTREAVQAAQAAQAEEGEEDEAASAAVENSLASAELAAMKKPTIRYLASLAGLRYIPMEGSAFVTKGGRGRPCCVEYSAKAPHGKRYGALPRYSILTAKEVDVVRIPAWRHLKEQWGLCIRCESSLRDGDCWVNITRHHKTFAYES